MARKSPKDLSLLKRGLAKSCLAPKAAAKGRTKDEDDDEDGEHEYRGPAPKKPKGFADSVMGKR